MKKIVFALLTASLIAACAKSPTGRTQLKLFSSNQMDAMGVQAFDGMKQEQKIANKPVQNAYVQCVAKHVASQVPQSVFAGEWEVVVFDDEQVNAFALPGGKIGVYTGLLNVAKNQDQLAAVIGHEVGHVIAEHGNERMSIATAQTLTLQVVDAALKTNDVAHNQEIMAGLGLGAQIGVQLPFSRTHESEADIIGLELMAKAGFNPQQAVDLWHNMDAASGGQRPMEWLSTHPAPASRIEKLQEHMPVALSLRSSNRPRCE